MTATTVFTVLAGIIAAVAIGIYFFGIPPEAKREMERQALKTMGENKMSYMAKDQINKIPSSDQEDVKQLKKSLGNAAGGVTNNPVGEQTGRIVHRAWTSMEDISKITLDRASTAARKARDQAQAQAQARK